jgi:peptide/nickel transport system ATP-binding protein
MQIIFQDPFSSLNPRFTVEDTLKEPLLRSKRATPKTLSEEIQKLMDMVGIARRLRMAYPNELDGGRRQRVSVGRALAMNPKFIVCDEPVSALDVSIQAQVLNLLQDLQDEFGLTYMFVTHDLSVVRHISKNISVMYLGQMVESCESERLFERPLHPYTQALLSAIPSIDIHSKKERTLIKGELTSPVNPKPGCRFMKRCPYACHGCKEPQELREIGEGHFVLCHMAEKVSNT